MTPRPTDRTADAAPASEGSLLVDRRRPGRMEDVDPSLIPLLRGQVQPGELVEWEEEGDQLAAARGISAGVLLSAPIWIGIVMLGHWLLS